MDRPQTPFAISMDSPALDRLMPMHLAVSSTGRITHAGPTLAKLAAANSLVGQHLFDRFEMRRPGGVTDLAGLHARAGQRLYLALLNTGLPPLRGIAMPDAQGGGMLINLSFGITLVEAVRQHSLTDDDFAPTDLAIELLYLVEAKSAVAAELRNLNLRLQGAKIAAEEQAMTDALTGLRNRRALNLELGQLLRRTLPFCLMHIDLDFFKAVNDTLGHAAGDHVLREVARILCAETRQGDTVARVGGDEFVVVLPALTDAQLLLQIASRIIAKLGMPMTFENQPCKIAASIGMTVSTLYTTPDANLMQTDADLALYASKRAGRARATFYAPQLVAGAGTSD